MMDAFRMRFDENRLISHGLGNAGKREVSVFDENWSRLVKRFSRFASALTTG